MKVAITLQQFSETAGGAEKVAVDLMRGLRQQGIQVDIYARKISEQIDLLGSRPYIVPCVSLTSAIRATTFASNLQKMLAKQKYDIIHAFTRTYYADVYRIGGGCHKEHLRRVSVSRGAIGKFLAFMNPKHGMILKLEKKSFEQGAYKKIVAVSERTKKEIIDNYQIPENDIRIIYNGVDTNKFNPDYKKYRTKLRVAFGLKDSDFVLLFCGNGFRTKGLDFALEAIALVSPQINCKFLIVGKGNVAHYRKNAYKLKLKDKIFFLGSRDNVHQIYGAVDALIHPSLHDPFPNVVLEAMSSGIPVITTKVTGTAEVITNNLDSIVVDHASDTYQLTEAVKLLANADTRNKMGQEARKTALRYSKEKHVADNLKLYDEIISLKSKV